jgi:hypothetical protein
MKFLLLWHIYKRETEIPERADRFEESMEAIIECEPEDFMTKRLLREKQIKEILSDDSYWRSQIKMGMVVIKLHQIVLLPPLPKI